MHTPTKISLLIDALGSGGAQRQLLLLGKVLSERGCKVELFYYHDIVLYDIEALGFPCRLIKRKFRAGVIFYLYKYLRVSRPHALIAYLRGPTLAARMIKLFLPSVRVITSQRNTDLGHSKKGVFLEKMTNRLSTYIVANTNAERELLLSNIGIDERRIRVIYNGFDRSRFFPRPEPERAQIRSEMGVPKEAFCILLPGRIQTQKNHTCLIKAIPPLIEHGADVLVLFVGDTIDHQLHRELEKLIGELSLTGRVQFLGRKSEIEAYYHAADAVVLPSLWEGLPNVLIEAMACGRIVVASDVADNPFIVDNGKTGFIFPSDDHAALAGILIELHEHRYRRDIESAASDTILKLCSSESMADHYLACINEEQER